MAKHIEKYFDGVYVEDLTAQKINNFQKSVSQDKNGKLMSEKFVKTERELLSHVTRYALSEHYITCDPFAYGVSKLKFKQTNPHDKVLSDDVVVKLCTAVQKSDIFKPMVLVLLRSGLRIGELLGLYWSDIDEINRVIHVRRAVGLEYEEDDNGVFTNCKAEICETKSKSSVRDVPTSAEVILTLNEWKQYLSNQPKIVEAIKNNGNEDLVFPNKYGKVRNYQGLRKQFDRFLDANGLAEFDITFHRLRHTYATIAREAGVGIDSISHLLGHKDIGVTSDVYVTPRKASLVQADDLVNKAINDLTNTAKKSPVSKNEITEKITVGSIKKAG